MVGSRESRQTGDARQSLGRRGEALAANYLTQQRYKILEQNYRSPYGEMDLIARQWLGDMAENDTVLVFIEVKTRTTNAFGFPEESVTPSKQARLIQIAQAYLQDHPEEEGNWRIDVIAIRTNRSGGLAEIRHFENAVH